MSEEEGPLETAGYLNEWVTQKVNYNCRDLIIYALGIGCTEKRFVYENDEDFAAFPTYPIVTLFKGVDQDVVSFPSPMMMEGPAMPPLPGIRVGLDGERYIEKVHGFQPEGGELIAKSRIVGVHKRGSGASVESETLLQDDTGKVYYKIISGSFLVGAKNFRDSGVTYSQKVKVPERPPDAVEEMPTSIHLAKTYRLSGDYNPLHIDESFAQMSGFKEPILHGLCSLGITARAVLRRFCGNDPDKFKAIRVRFASPVLPGQTLVVEMWKAGDRVILRTKVKETGKVVISNAFVDLVPASKL